MYGYNRLILIMNSLGALLLGLPRWLAFLQALTKPLATNYDIFLEFKAEADRDVTINCGHGRFEKALQVFFGSDGIYIEDAGFAIEQVYFYLENESQPEDEYLFLEGEAVPVGKQVYLFADEDYQEQSTFIVYVPFGMENQEDQIAAYVKKYKAEGTSFRIVFYNYIP